MLCWDFRVFSLHSLKCRSEKKFHYTHNTFKRQCRQTRCFISCGFESSVHVLVTGHFLVLTFLSNYTRIILLKSKLIWVGRRGLKPEDLAMGAIVSLKLTFQLGMLRILFWNNSFYYDYCCSSFACFEWYSYAGIIHSHSRHAWSYCWRRER